MPIFKNKKNYLLILAPILSILPIFLFTNNDLSIEKRIEIVKKCLHGSDTTSLSDKNSNLNFDIESTSYFSNELAEQDKKQEERNACAVVALGLPKDRKDVEIIMRSLISAAKTDKNVQVACHEIGHELGMRTWRKLEKDGLVLGLELCTYGYYHGYMRAAIESTGGESRIPFLVDFCKQQAYTKPITAEPDNFNNARFDFCAHGVGHAIGTASWDLTKSIKLCENFPVSYIIYPASGFPLGGSAGWCSTGVFNEKFFYPWAKELKTLSEKMKVCDPIRDVFKLHCSQYVASNSYLTIEEIKLGCKELKDAMATGCYQGAMQALVRKILFPSGANKGLDYYTNPKKGADLVNDVCEFDTSGNCGKQFAADSLSTVQSTELVLDVCKLLTNKVQSYKCIWQVERLKDEGFKYIDN